MHISWNWIRVSPHDFYSRPPTQIRLVYLELNVAQAQPIEFIRAELSEKLWICLVFSVGERKQILKGHSHFDSHKMEDVNRFLYI